MINNYKYILQIPKQGNQSQILQEAMSKKRDRSVVTTVELTTDQIEFIKDALCYYEETDAELWDHLSKCLLDALEE